jgi:DNA-binding NtrC family response regulator
MSDSTLLLLVDDKPENLDILVSHLEDVGYDLAVALSGDDALEITAIQTPSLVLLDVMMPGIDGFQTCQAFKKQPHMKDVPVIFMSALTDTVSKVHGFSVGGVDFITKPFHREEVLARIHAHLTILRQRKLLQLQNQNLHELNLQLQAQINKTHIAEQKLNIADSRLSALTEQEAKHWGIDAFVGNNPVITSVLEEVRSLQSVDKTNVLVLGESGTGKELISRAIHFGSARQGNAFVAVNCSAIPTELADAEFFGHTKGAFTGAFRDRKGHFVDADGGTLFLDEIGDMPLLLQAKLLRVLDNGVVVPVGGSHAVKVNVRIVAATNMDLLQKVADKSFRQDLYFRLAGYVIKLPPLRKRIDDIPVLAEHLLALLAKEMGREKVTLSAAALSRLQHYHFPGNVRELRNLIEYALISSKGKTIEAQHFHFITETTTTPQYTVQPCAISQDLPLLHKSRSDEDTVLAYIKKHASIDNSIVQQLLNVEHNRASYLLKKLLAEKRITKQGQRRWAHYVLLENKKNQ